MDNIIFQKPDLTIVTPTREGFSAHWLENISKVKGNVEFILVHPPEMEKVQVDDYRIQQINAPFRGEIIQRMTGLLNARAEYTLTINCDEYLIPEIAEIVKIYFQRFPNSWILRLARKSYVYGEKDKLSMPWSFVPSSVDSLPIWDGRKESKEPSWEENYLQEMPIAPLQNSFDINILWRDRKDYHGRHTENFDKKVWKTKLVKDALIKLSQNMTIFSVFKYIPFWCLDRLLGLAIQANCFTQNGDIIGHILPLSEQIRIEDNPPEYRGKPRYYVLSELILLKSFPQYPYIWNLVISNTIRYGFLFIKESIKGFSLLG
ncbi:hypothetical protein AA637_07190 [Cyanobacterium sp. HL-69]|uniref:glycosyltransferase n=1 Tax=Cyanobacterium sp. HL-69 TaxID=2054282 RepID=UPI000CA1F985|nr:hypothetical protein AA637_07190 [Cyanobacterium sp. HL-69]